MQSPPQFHALIAAAGQGTRSGLDRPKQFADLHGWAVVRWSVEAFLAHPACVGVTVVVAPGETARHEAELALTGLDVLFVAGGLERQQSVTAGLTVLDETAAAIVLIHDAARPGVSAGVIDALLATFGDKEVAGAVPVLDVVDTLAREENGLGPTVDRRGLLRVQTPQAFRLGAVRGAHAAAAGTSASDDAGMVRAAGGRVATVPGDRLLDKITIAGDLHAMRQLIADPAGSHDGWRHAVGSGFDVHALVPGDGMWMGGVWIAHDRALEGHSDADVVLHAITDALLGALGEGDIGQHFPPSDPQWRGAASDKFLQHAVGLAAARGARIDHLDCTIICEAPKIGPHREAIRARIADIAALPLSHVSVKATTTERLGFTGRGEGIAAQAVVSVAVPLVGDEQ